MSRRIGCLLLVWLGWASVAAAQIPTNIAQIGGATPITARCDDPAKVTTVAITTATSGNTQLVALSSNQTVYVCGYDFIAGGTVNVLFNYGTGSACGTGTTNLTGAYPLVAQAGLVRPNTGSVQVKSAVSNAFCINLSANVQVSGMLTYVKE